MTVNHLLPMNNYSRVPKFITNADDLVTPHETTVAGFLTQALEKTRKATLYSEAATEFYRALQNIENINTLDVLLDDDNYRDGLIAAAGFSLKAKSHITRQELDEAIKRVFSTLRDNFGEAFREEIVYRYLLTMGDTLGGSMRNYIGMQAGIKLTNALRDALSAQQSLFSIRQNDKGKVQRISWHSRLLLFDAKTKLTGNNVDVVLLDTSLASTFEELVTIPQAYLACGELKGGVDPAGADEHWKTARSALGRIQTNFTSHSHHPALFFIGAAIQRRMAREIYAGLQSGLLTHAANLTVPEQVEDLAAWLVALQLTVTS
jgi:type II restriction enzyme